MPGYEPWDADRATGIIADHAHREGATLPILHALQETFGYVDAAAVPLIAEALNLSRAEVHGCLTFYHDFRKEPAGRHTVKLCRAEACQARGVDALAAALPDQERVRIETVYCLGLCSVGPNAMVGNKVHARLDAARLGALVETLA